MSQLDDSKKVLHVAVSVTTTKQRGETFNEGLICYPPLIYNEATRKTAKQYFENFFRKSRQIRVVCIETEMGPQELASAFQERFGMCGFRPSLSIGGVLAMFTISPGETDTFLFSIETNQDRFEKSKENALPGNRPRRAFSRI